MKLNTLNYSLAFLLIFSSVVLLLRGIFPQNHAYASITIFFGTLIFALYSQPSVKKAAGCFLLLFIILTADSYCRTYILTSVKTSESLLFPFISSFIAILPILLVIIASHIFSRFRKT